MGSLYHLPAGRISPFSFEAEVKQHAESFGQFDGGGPPSDNGGMEARVTRLENKLDNVESRLVNVESRLTRIEAKLDHMATKDELAKMESSLIKWIVGTAIALGTIAVTVIGFVLPQQQAPAPIVHTQPAPAPAPTVIVVPTPAATPASS